jgi:hypothetical protein
MTANSERRLIKALKSTGRRRFAAANRRFFDNLSHDYVGTPLAYQWALWRLTKTHKKRGDMHCDCRVECPLSETYPASSVGNVESGEDVLPAAPTVSQDQLVQELGLRA